jgi:type III pantothenate kinase
MILLFDIGNTHTHVGLANEKRVADGKTDMPTRDWFAGIAGKRREDCRREKNTGALLCSVVPRATPLVRKTVRALWKLDTLELTPKTLRGVGIDYPKPDSIGPDRLANAVAARKLILARRSSWWISARR